MSQVTKTPQSNYTGPIVVDPLTRIEGHLRIEVEVEGGKIKEARSCGTLFRGLETILKGRDPRDAQHFTQRTCGVCTYTHALASTRCLEDAINKPIPANATYIRNLVLGNQFMHDHLVHFYHLHALDFVDVTSALQADPAKAAKLASSISPRKATTEDFAAVQAKLKTFVNSGQLGPFTNAYFLGGHQGYYMDPEANLVCTAHYLQALRAQVEIAKGMAVFGAKNPHTQFTVAGGVTCYEALTPARIKEFRDLYTKGRAFIEEVYIPDLLLVASYYKDWANIGGTNNFMAFGEFPAPGGERDLNSRWYKPGVIYDRKVGSVQPFDPSKIDEQVRHSWYEGDARTPYNGETNPHFTFMGDTDKYSWNKAPRYDNHVMETGPLAQMLVAYGHNHKTIKPTIDAVLGKLNLGPEALFSTLGRTAARGIQTLVIAQQMENWINDYENNIVKDKQIVEDYAVPTSGRGVGFLDAPRGGLSHWMTIKDSKIDNFQLVVPTTWNLGPRDDKGQPSAAEAALVGTPVADPKRPVEILRTIHSFDPCIACSVHVIDGETNEVNEFKVL
ncbi:nickel-dependent hydrogenase large subunit [Desulfovibrio intestinalis]|uniref:Periplasmic [NiFe] hydrogenase large subunit n=1 Tax=Desulfovibrio intestinalis TaxID=58621 RepID=A0A7W8C310_9BACT|nr:nickel-dependent hydrogenase large subunit [Desulfovibrio intestinalis]MBB5142785.1 [NiFe] hydrogenase large subunit [Desulfovibrio intestinalis]